MTITTAACLLSLCISSTYAQADTQPSVIQTPEIIRILESEAVVFVATTHSQFIQIQLEDGSQYQGTYKQTQAGKYSKDPNLSDILNLVLYIREHRPPEEVTEWQILCE